MREMEQLLGSGDMRFAYYAGKLPEGDKTPKESETRFLCMREKDICLLSRKAMKAIACEKAGASPKEADEFCDFIAHGNRQVDLLIRDAKMPIGFVVGGKVKGVISKVILNVSSTDWDLNHREWDKAMRNDELWKRIALMREGSGWQHQPAAGEA